MKEYHLMAINKGSDFAMVELGKYYMDIESNYNEMIKYYLMAMENGNDDAMYKLGKYCGVINNSAKYYLMAIKKGNDDAMYKMGFSLFHKSKY